MYACCGCYRDRGRRSAAAVRLLALCEPGRPGAVVFALCALEIATAPAGDAFAHAIEWAKVAAQSRIVMACKVAFGQGVVDSVPFEANAVQHVGQRNGVPRVLARAMVLTIGVVFGKLAREAECGVAHGARWPLIGHSRLQALAGVITGCAWR